MTRPDSEGIERGTPAGSARQPRTLSCQNWLSDAWKPLMTVGRLTFIGTVTAAVVRYGPLACSTQRTLAASFGSVAVKWPFLPVTAFATGTATFLLEKTWTVTPWTGVLSGLYVTVPPAVTVVP